MTYTLINLKQSGGYSAQNIANVFKKYNMIIYTSEGVYDTTKYNLCKEIAFATDTSIVTTAGSQKALILAYNPIPDAGGLAKKIDQGDSISTEYRHVIIPEHTIEKVILKSYRNFLPNQTPIAKV